MKIDVLNVSNSEIKFIVEGIKADMAGELRRIMISELPTMAIEWVDFIKNDSALPDEVVANRLGQVPFTFDKKTYNLPSECKCKGKGCSRCQIKMSLKKKGPGMVYASDIKTNAKDVKPVFERIPIVELFDNQEMEFNAIAQLGKGKEHVKWQSAVVGYKNVPKISVSVKDKKNAEKLASICPKHILKVSGTKITVKHPLDCDMCIQCVDAVKEGKVEGSVSVEAVEDSFVFNVETASGLKPNEIVSQAAELLESKMKDFAKAVRKIK
jgi:DNA-directed RNA polymerase subunit D